MAREKIYAYPKGYIHAGRLRQIYGCSPEEALDIVNSFRFESFVKIMKQRRKEERREVKQIKKMEREAKIIKTDGGTFLPLPPSLDNVRPELADKIRKLHAENKLFVSKPIKISYQKLKKNAI